MKISPNLPTDPSCSGMEFPPEPQISRLEKYPVLETLVSPIQVCRGNDRVTRLACMRLSDKAAKLVNKKEGLLKKAELQFCSQIKDEPKDGLVAHGINLTLANKKTMIAEQMYVTQEKMLFPDTRIATVMKARVNEMFEVDYRDSRTDKKEKENPRVKIYDDSKFMMKHLGTVASFELDDVFTLHRELEQTEPSKIKKGVPEKRKAIVLAHGYVTCEGDRDSKGKKLSSIMELPHEKAVTFEQFSHLQLGQKTAVSFSAPCGYLSGSYGKYGAGNYSSDLKKSWPIFVSNKREGDVHIAEFIGNTIPAANPATEAQDLLHYAIGSDENLKPNQAKNLTLAPMENIVVENPLEPKRSWDRIAYQRGHVTQDAIAFAALNAPNQKKVDLISLNHGTRDSADNFIQRMERLGVLEQYDEILFACCREIAGQEDEPKTWMTSGDNLPKSNDPTVLKWKPLSQPRIEHASASHKLSGSPPKGQLIPGDARS